MNTSSTFFAAWWPILLFPTKKQPDVALGNFFTAGVAALGLLLSKQVGGRYVAWLTISTSHPLAAEEHRREASSADHTG